MLYLPRNPAHVLTHGQVYMEYLKQNPVKEDVINLNVTMEELDAYYTAIHDYWQRKALGL